MTLSQLLFIFYDIFDDLHIDRDELDLKIFEKGARKALGMSLNLQGLCRHGRRRKMCVDCKEEYEADGHVSDICEHLTIRRNCKICKGGNVCQHGKRKNECPDCKEEYEAQGNISQICEHGRIRSHCRDCDGSIFCEHNKERAHCVKCKGSQICQHNKERNHCALCSGKGTCIHDRQIAFCKDCKEEYEENGFKSQICEHNRERSKCKDCKEEYEAEGHISQICEHGKLRNKCIDCKGSGVCKHSKIIGYCYDCGDYDTYPQNWCKLCKKNLLSRDVKKKYSGYCSMCYFYLHPELEGAKRFKFKENYLRKFLEEDFELTSYNETIHGGCSSRKPDFFIECYTHSVIIECDEEHHAGYNCENKRDMELFQDLGNRPLIMIRFNPDKYVDEDGVKHSSCFDVEKDKKVVIKEEWNERYAKLKKIVNYYIKLKKIPTKEFTNVELFY